MQHALEPQTAQSAHNVHLQVCASQEVAVPTFLITVPTFHLSMLLIHQRPTSQAITYTLIAKLLWLLIWILLTSLADIVCQASMEHQPAAGTIPPTTPGLQSLQISHPLPYITSATISSLLKKLRWLKLWSQLSWLLYLSFTLLEKANLKILYIQDF